MYHGVHRCSTGPNITGHRNAILALVLMMVIVQQPAAIDGLRRKVAGYMHIHAHELPGIAPTIPAANTGGKNVEGTFRGRQRVREVTDSESAVDTTSIGCIWQPGGFGPTHLT